MMSKSKDSMQSLVKNYLEKTCRPFSANDVFNNLNTKDSKLSKTAVTKALEELAEKHDIIEKVNGKQKIYFAIQYDEDIGDHQMKQLEVELNELDNEYNNLKTQIKPKESKLAVFKNSIGFEQISQQISDVMTDINDMEKRLQVIKKDVKDIDPKVNQNLKDERQKLVTEWKRRKRMATNIIDIVLDSYPKSKKILIEEIGIETDEEVKASVSHL
ncbi:homologous-pairing protein 2 homolog [Oppia nitens]|uniref:homologous-pairing protein 2 homolog n=1 Tax=Oppia nitens TaxID=1686743 RepID=UPI0023DBFE42|nr:homologous-pairing protein 2 homolog [Oppia nitens]